MEHQTLYRKYRPKNLDEVRGQEGIVSLLKQVLKNNNPAHAYLFIGGRGTGKTSVARIFAAELGIAPVDITEIDAASNRGIDEIRELKESVHTQGFESAKKMYIIDEVHMLTTQAFNALLKTLEEPPKHVIFVLATTDADKVPATIKSRCQIVQFRKPVYSILETLVCDISEREGITLEAGVATKIAQLGDGSFRDTLSHLDMIITSALDKNITCKHVEMISGMPQSELVISLLESIVSKNTITHSLQILRNAENSHLDMLIFMRMFVEYMRIALLLRLSPEQKDSFVLTYGEDITSRLHAVAFSKEKPITSKTLVLCLDTLQKMEKATFYPEMYIELCVLSLYEEA